MNILVVGGGGREHALIQGILKNPAVSQIFALPGNGGIALEEKTLCVPIAAENIHAVAAYAAEIENLTLAVIGPDDPLALGLADLLRAQNIPCFGPGAAGAKLESSKLFAKEFMQRHNIPTGKFAAFQDEAEALAYVEQGSLPMVVKADGLAKGKGVVVAKTREEAKNAVSACLSGGVFGAAGATVLIEEYLEGPEVSVLAFCDGKTLVPMVSSMDHKAAFDGDTGPNTGGMGVVAPNSFYDAETEAICHEKIFQPTLAGLAREGIAFQGCLYFGLMLTQNGPKVIEYNSRFGDPEAQAVLPLLTSDLLTVLLACATGNLAETAVSFRNGAACCVVLAAKGYPGPAEHAERIVPHVSCPSDIFLFHSGTTLANGTLQGGSGRVLGVTATAETLEEAVANVYRFLPACLFEKAYYRTDIGQKALACAKEG